MVIVINNPTWEDVLKVMVLIKGEMGLLQKDNVMIVGEGGKVAAGAPLVGKGPPVGC